MMHEWSPPIPPGRHRDLPDDDRMVAGLVPRDDAALEMRERAIEQRHTAPSAREGHAIEPARSGIRESARELLLILRQQAAPEVFGSRDGIRCGPVRWRA